MPLCNAPKPKGGLCQIKVQNEGDKCRFHKTSTLGKPKAKATKPKAVKPKAKAAKPKAAKPKAKAEKVAKPKAKAEKVAKPKAKPKAAKPKAAKPKAKAEKVAKPKAVKPKAEKVAKPKAKAKVNSTCLEYQLCALVLRVYNVYPMQGPVSKMPVDSVENAIAYLRENVLASKNENKIPVLKVLDTPIPPPPKKITKAQIDQLLKKFPTSSIVIDPCVWGRIYTILDFKVTSEIGNIWWGIIGNTHAHYPIIEAKDSKNEKEEEELKNTDDVKFVNRPKFNPFKVRTLNEEPILDVAYVDNLSEALKKEKLEQAKRIYYKGCPDWVAAIVGKGKTPYAAIVNEAEAKARGLKPGIVTIL